MASSQDTLELDFGAPAKPKEQPAERVPEAPAAKKLTLIDASGYIFRAYHALPGLTTSKGLPTHAVLGFTRMLLKTLREQSPAYVALCFDKESRKGRLEIDPTYKANREAPPEDLVTQFALIRKVAHALNIPVLEVAGWEADDVIATLVERARKEGWRVRIIASDKDFIQLLDGDVEVYDPVSDRLIGPKEAEAKYHVKPAQMADYLALVGDAIDNVAKVPGIGPKTAVELLAQFGNVEALIARLAEVNKPKVREALQAHVDTLRRAKKLVSFKTDLELGVRLEDLARRDIHQAEARALFTELEFFRLIQEMPAAQPTHLATQTEVIIEPAKLAEVAGAARKAKELALVPAFEGLAQLANLVGLGLALPDGRTFYVPLAHRPPCFPAGELQAVLGAVIADADVQKSGHDLKAASHVLAKAGLQLRGASGDVELLSYLLNPSRKEHALSDLARERLGAELPPLPHTKKVALTEAGVEESARCYGAYADAVHRLAPQLWDELEQVGLAKVAREIELPLLPVLASMERAGVKVDRAELARLSAMVDRLCAERLADIYRLAGRELNVGSPAQLAQVLFTDLKLPVLKKGKTGPSTDQEVLEKLAAQHPLPQAIIDYRNVAKLKSTYLDTLPQLIAEDGRVHTTLHQAAAATGRLSSSDPNLQNIPIRTELGQKIRRAFVAEEGGQLISADYSQIELRILAHIAGDEALVKAFAEDADVHTRTAAEVFGVPPQAVTPDQRRAAKMVNYGIAYGLSPHGLSTRLDIPAEEAKSIIDRYFARYTGIHRYLEETVAKAHKSGFVETLFGRRRYMPELGSKNRAVAMAAERAAINMPIQGTAADLIKLAMLRIDSALREQQLRGRMVLQVHDELLFEVPQSEVEKVRSLAVEVMTHAAAFRVPLKVDVGVGRSWADAH
ncbi:MAG: DNA polymerase I [Myxococcota bacterium]